MHVESERILKSIVATQNVEQIDKLWGHLLSNAPYHVAYLAFINADTGEILDNTFMLSGKDVPMSFSVEFTGLSESDYCYTDSTIFAAVMDAYNEFPATSVPYGRDSVHYGVAVNAVGNRIAQNTRRGVGKHIIEGFVLYKGDDDLEVPPTLWKVIAMYFATLPYPEIRHYYTIAKDQYIDRHLFPKPNVDGGLIVSEAVIDGVTRYALFKHPNFESYGFKIT